MNLSYKKRQSFIISVSMFFVVMAAFIFSMNRTQTNAASQGINSRYRTQQEIRNYVATNGATMNDTFTFTANPFTELP